MTLSRRNTVIEIQPVHDVVAPICATKKNKSKAQIKSVQGQKAKAPNHKTAKPPLNSAMSEALEEAMAQAKLGKNERSLDATKDYYRIRDSNGSFGSHPAHDDYDE